MMENYKELTESPWARLRTIADAMEKGEIRSFYLVTVSKSGKAVSSNFYVTPNLLEGPDDLLNIGESCLQMAELADKTFNGERSGFTGRG